MEDAKVLNPKHRAAGFYGLLALSALSAIGSFWLAVAPPVLKSDRLEQEIVAALSRGESYQGAAPVAWAKALSLFLGGVAATTGFGGLSLSSARPKTLSTPVLDDVANPRTTTTLPQLSDRQYAHQGQVITEKLTQLFDEHPWLGDVVDIEGSLMDVLIIVGMPGKGKSCLASAIGLLRKVMHYCPLYIFDADADKNVRTGIWVTGQVAGLTTEVSGELAGDHGHLDYKQQHDRMQAAVLTELRTHQEPAATLIYDEEQRLSANGFDSKDIQKHYETYTAYRKRGDKVIHLWHAATRSGSGLAHLPKDSALLTELLDYAAVIDFNAAPVAPTNKRRRNNKEKNSDRAMYKPAGVKYSRSHMELITIPKLLHPQTLIEQLGGAAEYFDVRLSGYRDPGLAQRRAAIKKKVRRQLLGTDRDPHGNFKSGLEKVFETPLAQHYLANKGDRTKAETEDGFDLEGLPNRDLFIALLTYLENPTRAAWVNEDGFYPVRNIVRGWAGKKVGGVKRFSSTDSFRTFLQAYNLEGLGEWGDEGRTLWRGRYTSADFA